MLSISDVMIECKRATGGHFSDIHIKVQDYPRIRTTGGLEVINDNVIEKQDIFNFIEEVRPTLKYMDALEEQGGEFDFSFNFEGDHYRANLAYYNGRQMLMLVMRKLDREIRPLKELGLPESLLQWLKYESGIILVVGATGAGKTSTLAAFVEHLNQTKPVHILTAEDPIEIRFDPKMATITQREIGQDTATFASAARAAMREDPDVILIGEIRDLASAREAMRLAETGHLVLTTLHADSAAGAVDRLARIFEATDEQKLLLHTLASQLVGVIYQCLLVSKEKDSNGISKRVLAYETITNTSAIENLIRENKIVQISTNIQMSGRLETTFDLPEVLDSLKERGLIDEATAKSATSKRDRVQQQRASLQ